MPGQARTRYQLLEGGELVLKPRSLGEANQPGLGSSLTTSSRKRMLDAFGDLGTAASTAFVPPSSATASVSMSGSPRMNMTAWMGSRNFATAILAHLGQLADLRDQRIDILRKTGSRAQWIRQHLEGEVTHALA